MKSKRVFILGAGSSISHSNAKFPSISEFFNVAQERGFYDKNGFTQISEYVQNVFGKDIKSRKPGIDIEDLLTHIEIEIERSPLPKLLSIRQEMLAFIRKLLVQLSDEISGIENDYDTFCGGITKPDSIITFNWDILLDNSLGRERILSEFGNSETEVKLDHYKEFISKLTALAEGTVGYPLPKLPYSEWNVDRGHYIKVHGSIDWFYCANEACRSYRKVFPVADLNNQLYCAYCHEELNCMIIPPILNKGYRNYPLIRTLWNLASKEISIADEIVVWGYSLPPTDFYAKWLLRQARHLPLKKLIIINPEVESKFRNNPTLGFAFIRRFYDLFRDVMPKKILNNSLFLYRNYEEYILGKDVFEISNIPKKLNKYQAL